MSSIPINQSSGITAPTPQNTPLTQAPISATLSRPTVPDISEDAEPGEDSTNVHDAVFGLVQGRLAGLLGKSSGYIEGLPDGAKKTLEALKGVQVKQNELQNQYKRECLELEKKVSHPIRLLFFSLLYPLSSTALAPLTVRTYSLCSFPQPSRLRSEIGI
jgi:nucleosome assembly protein 1-like 1